MIQRGVRRALAFRYIHIRELGEKHWTLCPAEETRIAPALYLPGAPDKITALSPWRKHATQTQLMSGGTVAHAASIAILLRNVDLADAYLYSGAAKAHGGAGAEHLTLPKLGKCQSIHHANIVTSHAGSHFFGCHLLDDMPLALISEANQDNIEVISSPYSQSIEYRDLLAIAPSRVVCYARIATLVIYIDFAQNSFKEQR